MKQYKRIILVGKAGSGKDYLRSLLEECGFKFCVAHTSRPIRNGEVNGKDYHFVSLEDAKKMAESDLFYEWNIFNEWIYGTSKEEFYKSQLFIMTPSGIKKLKPEDREESIIAYIDIDETNRRERLLRRRDADSVNRRIASDEIDFSDFDDYDFKITNPEFTLREYVQGHVKFLNTKNG